MSAADYPPANFGKAALDLAQVGAGARFGRIYFDRYPDPLGVGKSPSRFSDPRRRVERNRFGVLYLGSTLKVCFLEAVLRDRRNGEVADIPISLAELVHRVHAEIEVRDPLTLIDLRGNGPVRMGIPSDVVRGSSQTLSRLWSVAFHEHPAGIDGIIYPSRLNEDANLAVYDRAIVKLAAVTTVPLLKAPRIGNAIRDFKIAII